VPAITRNVLVLSLITCLTLLSPGCVIQSFNSDTGIQRFWGLGYVKVRISAPKDGVRVQGSKVRSLGVAITAGQENYGISLGFEDRQRLRISTNTAICIEWQTADMLGIRAGTNFPPDLISQKSKEP